jgi:ABC-2 type transport system ATP-binding protein
VDVIVSTGDPAILTRGLVKRYGALTAVDGVDLQARTGTCLGVLGPNGAGKTTTIETLEGLTEADAGEVRVLGRTWAEGGRSLRARIGVQLQETRLPEKLTVEEVLRTFRAFYPHPKPVDEVLELVGLVEKRRARTVNLSGGQRQRLALGCAVVGDPDVLFLDEPTTGLDPQARRRVWEIVEHFKASGRTVLLTTHYMDEAERLSDDLVILDHGKVIAHGSPAAIIRSLGAENVVSLKVDGAELRDVIARVEGVKEVLGVGNQLDITVQHTEAVLPRLIGIVRESGATLTDLHVHRPTLEDVFVSLTGRQLRDN